MLPSWGWILEVGWYRPWHIGLLLAPGQVLCDSKDIVQWTLSEIIDSEKNEVELTKATLGGSWHMRGIECNILDSFLPALLQRPELVYFFLQPRSLQSNQPAHCPQYFNATKWVQEFQQQQKPWLVSIDVVNGIMSRSRKDTLKLFEREISVICRFNYMSWRYSNYKFLFLLTCQKLILLIGRSIYFSKNTRWPEPPHWLDSIDLLNFDVLYCAE